MGSGLSPRGLAASESESELNFGFAFNDSNFSDRVLRIEILEDLPESKADAEGCSSVADWARNRADLVANRKRRREDFKKSAAADVLVDDEEPILKCSIPCTEDNEDYENLDDVPMAVHEELTSAAELDSKQLGKKVHGNYSSCGMDCSKKVHGNYSSCGMDCSTVVRIKIVHISSPILAAKSPFFYKLFSNGMMESDQHRVALRINASEEAALMDLLNFMYSNTLSAKTPARLLDVLMASDKYQVASCMRYCSQMLRNLPMNSESALLFLDLPSSILMAETVKPLTDDARKYFAARYKDMTRFPEELVGLPLAGVEAVLSSDDIQVSSEDIVYDFVLKWSRVHYPKLEDRCEVLHSHLIRHIRFPYMTCRKLRKVLACSELDPGTAAKLVLEALFFRAEPPSRQLYLKSCRRFIERAYKYRPVKVVEFELPRPQCMVYLDLRQSECQQLFPSGRVYSQAFHLGGQGFFLSSHCTTDPQSQGHCFGLFLGMQEKGASSFAVEYEFGVRVRPGEEFVSKYKGSYTFTGGKAVGYRNLFGIPWEMFIADESMYFINGVLHLRADLTIR